jgi:hypothetical protein
VAAGEIDDRQAAHAEHDVIAAVEPLVVRPTMVDRGGHAAHVFDAGADRPGCTRNAYDPAHVSIRLPSATR